MKEYKIVHKTKPILLAQFWGKDALALAKKWVADWNTDRYYDREIKTIKKEDLEILEE